MIGLWSIGTRISGADGREPKTWLGNFSAAVGPPAVDDDLGQWTEEKILSLRNSSSSSKLSAVGSTVDRATATWANTIGASEFVTVWSDPEFDAAERAFYYVRVLEIPTPPWYLYDVVKYRLDVPDGAPLEQQERAYTSPIWYTPKG